MAVYPTPRHDIAPLHELDELLVAEVANDILVDLAMATELDAFLADPMGYGDFDLTDPISLADFGSFLVHDCYIEPLT